MNSMLNKDGGLTLEVGPRCSCSDAMGWTAQGIDTLQINEKQKILALMN